MARDKERSINPATAALKSQKNASIKKQKASIAAQRTERLANRNPDRLQKQYDDLNALKESSGGKLKPKEQQTLQALERDLRLIKKAKQSDPAFGKNEARSRRDNDEDRPQALGKRMRGSNDAHHGRGNRDKHSDSEDTDPEVRSIPMPRDTPPPIPRRPHRKPQQQEQATAKEPVQHQTTYSAAPQLRDLRKEATDKFMPASVKARQRDKPSMLEPEEADALEENQRRNLEAQEAAFRKELGEEALDDAAAATDFAEQEANHQILADQAQGTGRDISANAESRLDKIEREEHEDVYGDIANAAHEAENEAVHEMIADGMGVSATGDKRTAERRLHQVEIEDAEDEDGPAPRAFSSRSEAKTAPRPPRPPQPVGKEDDDDKPDVFSWD